MLETISIKTPCSVPWESMAGDERIRFCCRCSKSVFNLSEMTEEEAEAFLSLHLDDDPCVRLFRRPDGRILTSDCPTGAGTRHGRRAALAVTAALAASAGAAVAIASVPAPKGEHRASAAHHRFEPPRTGVAPPRFDPEVFDPPSAPAPAIAADVAGGWYSGGLGSLRGGSHSPAIRVGSVRADGLPVDVVRRIVRQRFGHFRLCYENALRDTPALRGNVRVKLVIAGDGSVVMAHDAGSDLPDATVTACIVRWFANFTFPSPSPEGQQATVTYELHLAPEG